MDFNLATILALVTAFLAGGVTFLKVLAPKTKNKTDDKILEYAEKALDLLPGAPANKQAAEAPKA
jgi:hypothetical protein